MYIKNIWYVAAWSHELEKDAPYAAIIAGEPVVLWRDSTGAVNALEDRCPHRHAPLSMGRIEGDQLRCMYHGLKFEKNGKCSHIPVTDVMPPNIDARAFRVVEKGGWIWVWVGDNELADELKIPEAWGMSENNDEFIARFGALDYAADYQLINDNLTDLSHLDYVHETTLGAASMVSWSNNFPKIIKLEDRLRIQRWFPAAPMGPNDALVESFTTYDYVLPGIFLMKSSMYPEGTAKACDFMPPAEESPICQWEQQAVTPQMAGKSRYMFASGYKKTDPRAHADSELIEKMFAVILEAFAEDRALIEAQQRIWDLTPEDKPKAFIGFAGIRGRDLAFTPRRSLFLF
jgi:vanillate O-demethylase monooxygenase subunit